MSRHPGIPKSPRAALRASFYLSICAVALACSESAPIVENGSEISLLYQAKTVEGDLVDANADEGPMLFVVGMGKLQPRVETKLLGMKQGEEKTFAVVDAYGPYDDGKTGILPLAALPDDAKVGDEVQMADGYPSKIKEIRADAAVLDLNHPLAGKEIVFTVQVVEVRTPKTGEDASQPKKE